MDITVWDWEVRNREYVCMMSLSPKCIACRCMNLLQSSLDSIQSSTAAIILSYTTQYNSNIIYLSSICRHSAYFLPIIGYSVMCVLSFPLFDTIGMSVGGISSNRKAFISASMPFVDHLPHTYSIQNAAFSKGLPTWGAHLADELERLVTLHDASTIAAVIIEPVPGSTGVLPPPVGYLKKIREICTKHNILLIFDEVITGFGRVGAPFAANKFGIEPDVITCAKGLTNGIIPAGAVLCREGMYKAVLEGTEREGPGSTTELAHGYTYR